jgi:hypothetical protein
MKNAGVEEIGGIVSATQGAEGGDPSGIVTALVLMSAILGGLHLLRLLVGLAAHFTMELRRELVHLGVEVERLSGEFTGLLWVVKDCMKRVQSARYRTESGPDSGREKQATPSVPSSGFSTDQARLPGTDAAEILGASDAEVLLENASASSVRWLRTGAARAVGPRASG